MPSNTTNSSDTFLESDEEKSRMLIVEDDNVLCRILNYVFLREGYDVNIVNDGKAALDFIESAHADIVLLDIMLPYFDGYQILKTIRERTGWEKVPVIILSGKTIEHDIVRAFDLGANDYIEKPFKPAELLVRVKRFL